MPDRRSRHSAAFRCARGIFGLEVLGIRKEDFIRGATGVRTYEDAKAGKITMAASDSTANPAFVDQTIQLAQTRSLFSFQSRRPKIVISRN